MVNQGQSFACWIEQKTNDPKELLRDIKKNGISFNALEVLPALKVLKQQVAAAGCGC